MQNWSSAFGSDGVNSRLKELWGEALGVRADSGDGKTLSLPPTDPQLSLCCIWLVLEVAPLLCRTYKDKLAPGASSLPAALPFPCPWSNLCLGLLTEGCPGARETPPSESSCIFLPKNILAFIASTGHLLERAA